MIIALLWLLAAAFGVTHPDLTVWQGRAPVVLVRPSQPNAGTVMTVAIARMPRRARAVEIDAGGDLVSPERLDGTSYRTTLVAPDLPGPMSITIRFTLDGTRYEAPGSVVVVAPAS
jgi:hypothetical protein